MILCEFIFLNINPMFFSPWQIYAKLNANTNVIDYKWMLIIDSPDCVFLSCHIGVLEWIYAL